MDMTNREEAVELARQDRRLLEDLADKLGDYAFEVSACGRSGREQMGEARELARSAIKALVNYL